MAKGERTTSYFPTQPPTNDATARWMYEELKLIASWMRQPTVETITFSPLVASPLKPNDGLHAHADGVKWTPQIGASSTGPRGTYYFDSSTGYWVQLT